MYSKPRRLVLSVAACGLVAALGFLAVAVGISQSRLTWAAPSAPADVVVAIYDFYFDPPTITVSPGTTVVWRNWGEVNHTIAIPGVVTSGVIIPGEIFTHTFNSLGAFPYQCGIHSTMQGVVRVVNANQVPVDLWVTAWHDQVVSPSTTIDYHVQYANSDLAFGAQNTVLTVTLPTASTLVTSTQGGIPFPPNSQSGRTLVYQLGTLSPADSNVIDLGVHLASTLTVNSEVVLSARLSAINPDPNLDNNYTENAETIPGANMTISKRPALDSGPFVPGGVVTYALQYVNQSSYVAATSVVVTDRLPAGLTFRSALKDDWTNVTPITPVVSGNLLTFDLGTLQPYESGQLLVQVQLDAGLYAKTELINTAGVATTAMETTYDDNVTLDVQTVVPTQPDLWVEVHSSTDGQIDGYQSYWVNFGNSGPLDAHNVTVTLAIPIELTDLSIYPAPDTFVTRTQDYVATWFIGTLPANEWGNSLYAGGLISAAGQVTATATITSTSSEADPADNVARISDYNAEILMPIIEGPSTAIVGTQPVFFGLGQPNATVTLYLSGTATVSGRVLGAEAVDNYGRWVITPTSPINQPGWYWFTATQRLNNRLSPVTGVGNFVTDTLIMDTNSMTRDGERIGGINQPLGWRRAATYVLGVFLTKCAPDEVVSPTLQVLLFNDDGLMIGYHNITATLLVTSTGYVEFEYQTPEEGSFELFINYYCPVPPVLAGDAPRNPSKPSGWWQDLKDWFGCWESLGCDKPDPPPPPKPGCPGCTPIPRPRPRPKPTDPDGFVYDCSMTRAGASITQSIVVNAWVTATQRTGVGQFTDWNALEYDQVNPQYTDGQYPDKVQKPGYYSFLVPSGDYRIQANAPGYLPFESQVLHVLSTPVTLNVPMKRPGDVGECTPPLRRVYLPIVLR